MTSKQDKICADCTEKKKIVARGLCNSCYVKRRRKGQELPPRVAPPVKVRPLPEERPTQYAGPLSQNEIDALAFGVAQTATEPPNLDEPEGGESKGRATIREYLERNDHIARREVIRQLLGLGLTELQVITTFYNDESLCCRWVDPVVQPLTMFSNDFAAIKKERRKSLMVGGNITGYVEHLKAFLRMAHRMASDSSTPAPIRSTLLQAGIKLARDIALAEGVIHVVPGQGDLPLRRPGEPDEPPGEEGPDEGHDDGTPHLKRIRLGEGEFEGDGPEDQE